MSSHIDRLASLSEAIAKAQAMLYMAHGESGENFRSFSGEVQDTYLLTVSDLVESAGLHLNQLKNELMEKKGVQT